MMTEWSGQFRAFGSAQGLVSPSPWIADFGVSLDDLPAAEQSEDDFDALMTVAALLRLTLAGRPLTRSAPDPVGEGGILGT